MKLGAVSPVYNEESLITGCVKCLQDFVDTHIVLVSEKPYYGQMHIPDRTEEIASDLGADVITGVWTLDHHQRNTGIKLLQDCDWIICTDADMWMTKADMEKLIDVLSKTTAEAFIIPQYAYWKDTDHILEDDDFKPVIAIRPHVRFVHIGNIGRPFEVVNDIYVHHLNWCEPKDIYKKVLTYSHAPEFNGHEWYEKHYKTWQESSQACLPDRCYSVKKQSLPDELKAYLNN
jgi:glycosyltransferase involved in cell wall biosynthesis